MRFPNVYGVDMPVRSEFVASDKTEEQICAELGADALIYQSLEDLVAVGHDLNPAITEFDTSCFTGAVHRSHLTLRGRVGKTWQMVPKAAERMFDAAILGMRKCFQLDSFKIGRGFLFPAGQTFLLSCECFSLCSCSCCNGISASACWMTVQ